MLTDYCDASRHVVDARCCGMDDRKAIDELPHAAIVLEELAKNPCRREHCGRMGFAARAGFVGSMGWFDGKPTSLGPPSPKTEAERFIKLAG